MAIQEHVTMKARIHRLFKRNAPDLPCPPTIPGRGEDETFGVLREYHFMFKITGAVRLLQLLVKTS